MRNLKSIPGAFRSCSTGIQYLEAGMHYCPLFSEVCLHKFKPEKTRHRAEKDSYVFQQIVCWSQHDTCVGIADMLEIWNKGGSATSGPGDKIISEGDII